MNIHKCEYCGESEKRIIHFRGVEWLCNRHRIQKTRHGKIFRTRSDGNKIVQHGDYATMEIIKNEKSIIVKIDIADINRVQKYSWFMRKSYAGTWVNGKQIFLHHFVRGRKNGFCTDHINRDKLDNRKSNLRQVTYSENSINRSKQCGVTFDTKNNKWSASIVRGGKRYWLKRHRTFENALLARKKAEYDLYGTIKTNSVTA